MPTQYQLDSLDVGILDILDDGRNVPANITLELLDRGISDADQDDLHQRVHHRLRQLSKHDLVSKVGPHPNSGVYTITEDGCFVAEHSHIVLDDNTDGAGIHLIMLGLDTYRDQGADAARDRIDQLISAA